MKLETVYNELKALEGLSYFAGDQVYKVVEKIKKAIIDDQVKETTPAAKWTAIKKLLKVNKDRRPALSLIYTDENDQRFTDSYRLFYLKGDDMIENLPDEFIFNKNKAPEYPALDSIVQSAINDNKDRIQCSVSELKKLAKVEKMITIKNENVSIVLNSSYVIDALNILQFKNNETITFNVSGSNTRPITFNNKNGSLGLILPIRQEV